MAAALKAALFAKREPCVLGRTAYPAYTLTTLGASHIVISGGGGAAKTGVPNRIDVYMVDTGSSVAMCLAVNETNFGVGCAATGEDDFCSVYKIRPTSVYIVKDEIVDSPPESMAADAKQLMASRRLSYSIAKVKSYRSDHHAKDAFQKCVAIHSSENVEHVVTAGADGHVRVFKTFAGAMSGEHHAHQGDVDSVDLSPDGAVFISIGRDKKWFVYSTADCSRLTELPTPPEILNTSGKYKPRLVKFTPLGRLSYIFVAAFVPMTMDKRNNRSFLTLWSYNTQRNAAASLVVKVACNHVISAMCVSPSGDYVAIGTQSPGSVGIYDTHTMSKLYYVHETHDIFVTGVAFLYGKDDVAVMNKGRSKDSAPRLPTLTSDYRCAVISISGDQTIQLHTLEHAQPRSMLVGLLYMTVFAWLLYVASVAVGLDVAGVL